MKILVTGASGFLGSALARRLHASGHEVGLLLRPGSRLERLAGLDLPAWRCADTAEAAQAVRGFAPDALVHTACAYGRQGETAADLLATNVALGLALLQALAGTARAEGPRPLFLNTGSALPPDASAYALSKQQFSDWGRLLARAGGAQFINIRLQHMYGPGDDASKFSTRVLQACRRHEPRLPLTAGAQRRDFIYIDDVLDGYECLLRQAGALAPDAELDLGSGQAPTLREFVELAHRLTGSRSVLGFGDVPYRPGEPMLCQADLAAMAALGWQPRWSLEDGLRHTLDLEESTT